MTECQGSGKPPVVVSGFGTLSAAGAGHEDLAQLLQGEDAALVEVDRSQGYHLSGSSRKAATVDAKKMVQWLKPIKARRMSPPSRLAVVAARMALEDAGLDWREPESSAITGVYLATAYGPSSYTERILRQVLEEGPQAASPMLFTESVANAPAAQIALGVGATGPNITVTQRECGPLQAVAMGARDVASGRVDRALVGGVEELNPLLHSILDRFRALCRPDFQGREIARPFDRDRTGYLAGEGATVLVLERADDLAERSARARAIVGNVASAFDSTAPKAGWGGDPQGAARILCRRMERLGDNLDSDLVISGASGSKDGDRFEAALLADRDHGPVVTPRAWLGSWSGALLAGAMMACEGSQFARTPGFRAVDPELKLTPHDGSAVEARRIAVQTAAVGGAVTCLFLESAK